jgi:predicted amidohydrolase YtcJ
MKARQVTIVYNAKVYEGRERFSEAIYIEGGRVVLTGSGRELLDAAPAGAEKIDAEGRLVLPAFHDSHLHLLGLGRRAGVIDGAGAGSIEEVLRRGRELIDRLKPPPGTYVQGAGVNPDLFTGEKRDLTREDLDRISREHPVIISRHCGHTIYCNSLALKMAGFAESAPEMEGGTIEKDAHGRPTGVARENANALIRKPIPLPTRAELKDCFERAMDKALSLGITGVGSYDTNGPDFEEILGILNEVYDRRERPLRLTMQCGISGREDILDRYLEGGYVTGRIIRESPGAGPLIKMGPLKLFIDGTLGGQTAWMRQPYRDKSENRGLAVLDQGRLEQFTRKAAGRNMQVMVHAIGDAGIEAVIAAFEKVTGPARNPLRHGIIHCQVTGRDLLERMARNRILALVQPVFLADDMCVLEQRVGTELASTSYAWGTMESLGIPVSYGTDAPVSALDPLLGLAWAVRRQNPEDGFPPGGYYPNERVDLYTALDAYTAGSAFSSFDENHLGRLRPGFLADLVFLDRDIFSIPIEEIHRAKAVRTLLAGDTVWEAG